MTYALPFFVLLSALSFLAGVFVASFFWFPQIMIWAFFILGICLVVFFWPKKFFVAGLCFFFFGLGVWRYEQSSLAIEQGQLRRYVQTSSDITIFGFVSEPPQEREKVIRFPFMVEEVISKGVSNVAQGRVLVTASRYPVYSYREKLKIIGRLEIPKEMEGFNYRNYLASHGIEATISFPEIESLGEKKRGFFFSFVEQLFKFRAGIQQGIRRALSPPQSAVAEAVLFGDESGMSQDFKNALNASGLRHITAVSGMNITIISRMLLLLGLAIGLWRKHAFYFAIVALALYIFMIGAPASAVRAGIMGGLFLLAQHVGRPNDAVRVILFAAAIMVAVNPLSLPYDIGFQLSFLAVLGIIYLNFWQFWELYIGKNFFNPISIFFQTKSFYPYVSLLL